MKTIRKYMKKKNSVKNHHGFLSVTFLSSGIIVERSVLYV